VLVARADYALLLHQQCAAHVLLHRISFVHLWSTGTPGRHNGPFARPFLSNNSRMWSVRALAEGRSRPRGAGKRSIFT
jgi:hypothetical protein